MNLALLIALLRTQRRELSYINSHLKWAPVFRILVLGLSWMVVVGGIML